MIYMCKRMQNTLAHLLCPVRVSDRAGHALNLYVKIIAHERPVGKKQVTVPREPRNREPAATAGPALAAAEFVCACRDLPFGAMRHNTSSASWLAHEESMAGAKLPIHCQRI